MSRLRKSSLLGKITVLVVICCCLPAQGKYGGGTGEPNNPYQIADANDINEIGVHPNDWDKHFVMVNDINLSGIVYSRAVIAPDTNNTTWYFIGTPFTGTFNGSNHTIHNLTMDTTGTNNNYYIGLFGQLRSSTAVSNLRLQNANITGGTDSTYVGGLCGANGECDLGYDGGTINNCYFNGYVTCGNSSYFVGGLVGLNYWGTIQNCDTTGSVSCHRYSGGMVGWNFYGTISNCYTNGYVDGGDSSYAVGGLVGCSESSTISNCYSTGSVYGNGSVGGLVGYQEDADINNCYAAGSVNADGVIGNLVGRNSNGSISNCYSAGTITGKDIVGGLVGYNYFGTISNCHAADSVSGGDNSIHLGGLVGWNEGTINNCYAAGTVTGGISSGRIGGLAGRNGRTI
ncbi:MAG: GLUG motif-containing protein, partial [Planctomycetota bacterium]